ncbi:MAG: hypothetical protein M0R80_13610 [Proteobacteria bacterium]|nr:hypothetical protein [Pseudomonadota bacterium]
MQRYKAQAYRTDIWQAAQVHCVRAAAYLGQKQALLFLQEGGEGRRMIKGAIRFENIRPHKRICAQCGKEVRGRSGFLIYTIGRGKYLCHACGDAIEKK